jgi:hypothetical protein
MTLFALLLTACLPTLEKPEGLDSGGEPGLQDCLYYLDADGDGYGDPDNTLADWCEIVPSGYSSNDQDCDDADGASYPGAAEVCDDADNNCDGDVDEGVGEVWYVDGDGDGYGDAEVLSCDDPGEGYSADAGDCDDSDPETFPGAPVSCEPGDRNCDGVADDVDGDGDGFAGCEECDDTSALSYPEADELCDGADNDCDDATDESPVDGDPVYYDGDGDGYGDPAVSVDACAGYEPEGYVQGAEGGVPYDCDDARANVNPDEDELCDGIDNNCDGDTDEDGAVDAPLWYVDDDDDGYGTETTTAASCSQPEGFAQYDGDCDDGDPAYNPGAVEDDCSDPNDYNCDGTTGYTDGDRDGFAACEECDDANSSIYPGADEVCDDLDNDCDGTVDVGVVDADTWYADGDTDGFGDVDVTVQACDAPSGYVADGTDCDDGDSLVNPDGVEVCDGVDNDCDGAVDPDDALDAGTWYVDDDGDGYGVVGDATDACAQPDGYADNFEDCDDDAASVNPEADELCDGIDNNCDGRTDDTAAVDQTTWYVDGDDDGYGGSSTREACDQPEGYVDNSDDCLDSSADVYPGADEYCDGADSDCDNVADEGAVDGTTYYLDDDGDSFGDPDAPASLCLSTAGYSANSADCDDSDAAINPTASEACDGIDNDCSGDVDEGYVDTDGDALADCVDACPVFVEPGASGDGAEDDPYGTIADAIELRGLYCDEILLLPGTYDETVVFGGEDLVIGSTDGPDDTVIAAPAGGSVVTIDDGESADAVLYGVTLTGGTGTLGAGYMGLDDAVTYGGGLFIHDASPTVYDVVLEENTVDGSGGGVFFYGWSGSFSDSVVRDNTSTRDTYTGAGVGFIASDGAFYGNEVLDNAATDADGEGGGLYVLGTADSGYGPDIGYSVFAGNSAGATGAGIRVRGSFAVVFNNLIYDNNGDGIACSDLDETWYVNNTIDGNQVGVRLYANAAGGPVGAFVNNQITNSVDDGVRAEAADLYGFSTNNVWNSGDENYAYNEDGDSDISFGDDSGNLSQNPDYNDAGAYDFTLRFSSPCKDAGTDLSPLGFSDDFDGTSRPAGSEWSIGAYEE